VLNCRNGNSIPRPDIMQQEITERMKGFASYRTAIDLLKKD
jgi:hypothetical protein